MYFAVKGLPAPEPVAAPQPPLVDNLFAPEIFTTGTAGFANLSGVIVVTLQSVRCDHSREQPAVERFVWRGLHSPPSPRSNSSAGSISFSSNRVSARPR